MAILSLGSIVVSPEEKGSGSSDPDGSGTQKQGRSGWRKFLRQSVGIIGPIIIALTVAGVTAAVTGLTSSEPAGELQGFDPVVANPTVNYEDVPDPSNPALRPAAKPTTRSPASRFGCRTPATEDRSSPRRS